MDGYGYQGAFELSDDGPSSPPPQPASQVAAAIGTDERRMHVRAYNYWVSLLNGRDFPSIEDLEPESVTDFGPHSVLLDYSPGRDHPGTPYIGAAIREECGLIGNVRTINDVPSRSLLSRLTDHYLQIIANRAPIGFEAEFVNQAGREICYRGILMPFSSDGETIDFIYGVINWKASENSAGQPMVPMLPASEDESEDQPAPFDLGPADALADQVGEASHIAWDDGPLHDEEAVLDAAFVPPAFDEDAGLADRLGAARESADICKAQDGRSRVALYRALAMAYDFAVAARRATEDYAEILEDAGVKAQARAPMTPIVKLVFGADYDKTRLTEFAAALSFAERSGIDFEGFLPFIENQPGGLKGLVAAERQARRPAARPDSLPDARAVLRGRASLGLQDLPTNAEFALVLTRRNANGVHEVVSLIGDENLLERALRKAV